MITKNVTERLENLRINTIVSSLMEFMNAVTSLNEPPDKEPRGVHDRDRSFSAAFRGRVVAAYRASALNLFRKMAEMGRSVHDGRYSYGRRTDQLKIAGDDSCLGQRLRRMQSSKLQQRIRPLRATWMENKSARRSTSRFGF